MLRPLHLTMLCAISALALSRTASAGPFLVSQAEYPSEWAAMNGVKATPPKAILPTGRTVAPVGRLNGAPNLPTMLAIHGNQVAVLANGATPFQTLTFYDAETFNPIDRLAAFSKLVPNQLVALATRGGSGIALNRLHTGASGTVYVPKEDAAQKIAQGKATLVAESNPTAIPTTLLSHSDFFQGLTAGRDGVFYATGGDSDKVIALRSKDGKARVIRQYILQWQSFSRNSVSLPILGRSAKEVSVLSRLRSDRPRQPSPLCYRYAGQ